MAIKITSLALDKQPFTKDYFLHQHELIPVRWLPHEALSGEYSIKSDVWMFACTAWELSHSGRQPFGSLTDETVFKNLSNKSLHWDSSFCQSEKWASLLLKCWSYDLSLRPSFDELLDYLESQCRV